MDEPADGEDDEEWDQSYDSELEAEMFGGKDPELNAQLDKHYEMLNAQKEERKQAEEQAAAINTKPDEEKRPKKPKQKLDPNDFQSRM